MTDSGNAGALVERQDGCCPICGAFGYEPTSTQLDIRDSLRKWEEAIHAPLGQAIWDDYAQSPEMTLFGCSNCGFNMFEPPLAGTPDFYAAITRVEDEYYVSDRWEYRRAVNDIQDRGARRVLDVGSGSGHFLDMLRHKLPDVDVTAYEFSAEIAALVQAKGVKAYTGMFPQVLHDSAADAGFDAICAFQVLEHVADPASFLRDLVGLLRPNGILLISVPDLAGPVRYAGLALTNVPPHHVSWWKQSVFETSMARFGLQILDAAVDNLPHYLWRSYLPLIAEHHIRPHKLLRLARKYRLFDFIASVLKTLGLKEIPGVRGHTLYILLQHSTE